MNLFALDNDPIVAARYHCDKHVPKMVVETAQLLSTAHRILDGEQSIVLSSSGRKKKVWTLPDEREKILYLATHVNHPSAVWVRESSENYNWANLLLISLCLEFRTRFHKNHKTENLLYALASLPENIEIGDMTPFAKAMKSQPQCEAIENPVQAYREFYMTKQTRMKVEWERADGAPSWFKFI